MTLREDGSDRAVRVLIYRIVDEVAAGNTGPRSSPSYTYQRTRWARLAFSTAHESTVGAAPQHEMPVTFRFHDQIDVAEDDVLVVGTTVFRVTGINDPRTFVPGHLRSVQAVHADQAAFTLSGP
jgi:hypothetical protein